MAACAVSNPFFCHKMTTDNTMLHRCVFLNDAAALEAEIARLDNPQAAFSALHRGQTPLTLAITLGHHECIRILLENGASTLDRNAFGWSAYHEGISYGNRDSIKLLYLKKRQEYSEWVEQKGKLLLEKVDSV
jgi:ankyrin repeat protein